MTELQSATMLDKIADELLIKIVGYICDDRIDFFDPVATKTLQVLRLTCKGTLNVPTPFLFENMTLDLSFTGQRGWM